MAIEGGSFDSPAGSRRISTPPLLTPAERLNFDLGVVKAATHSPGLTHQQQALGPEGNDEWRKRIPRPLCGLVMTIREEASCHPTVVGTRPWLRST